MNFVDINKWTGKLLHFITDLTAVIHNSKLLLVTFVVCVSSEKNNRGFLFLKKRKTWLQNYESGRVDIPNVIGENAYSYTDLTYRHRRRILIDFQ